MIITKLWHRPFSDYQPGNTASQWLCLCGAPHVNAPCKEDWKGQSASLNHESFWENRATLKRPHEMKTVSHIWPTGLSVWPMWSRGSNPSKSFIGLHSFQPFAIFSEFLTLCDMLSWVQTKQQSAFSHTEGCLGTRRGLCENVSATTSRSAGVQNFYPHFWAQPCDVCWRVFFRHILSRLVFLPFIPPSQSWPLPPPPPPQTSGTLFARTQMQNHKNCVLNMQRSQRAYFVNMELGDARQNANVPAVQEFERLSRRRPSTVRQYVDRKRCCCLFSLFRIKMTHCCWNPVGQHDGAIKCGRRGLVLSSNQSGICGWAQRRFSCED